MATPIPIKIAVESSTLAMARSLLGSSSPGMTERTIVKAVLSNPMEARVMATGRLCRAHTWIGRRRSGCVNGEADSLLLLQFGDDTEQIVGGWVAAGAEHAHQAGFRDMHLL